MRYLYPIRNLLDVRLALESVRCIVYLFIQNPELSLRYFLSIEAVLVGVHDLNVGIC